MSYIALYQKPALLIRLMSSSSSVFVADKQPSLKTPFYDKHKISVFQNIWRLSKSTPHKSMADETSPVISYFFRNTGCNSHTNMLLFWHSVKDVNEVREVIFVELISEERNALQIQIAATNSAIKQRKSGILFVINCMSFINMSTFLSSPSLTLIQKDVSSSH